MQRKILFADPDAPAREPLARALADAGFAVTATGDGAEALRRLRREPFALLLAEVDLPELDGFALCREVQRGPDPAPLPVILLSARGAEIDRVIGLESGADDYIVKPCGPRELVLRLKRSLGRALNHPPAAPRLALGGLAIDRARGRAWAGPREVRLTAQEFKLLAALMERRGALASPAQLLREAWQYDVLHDTQTLHTHVRRLRLKLGRLGRRIENVRLLGYRIACDESEAAGAPSLS
jgi:DNA-binding response OmpR family regulator